VLLGNPQRGLGGASASVADLDAIPTDIRRLAELKKPKSASEMAALVAYYLAEAADPIARKDVVENADMVKFFKQAKFRLPGNVAMILVNAKNAGYFDSTGAGQYRLNPVGYNLVVHSLPRHESAASTSTSRNRPRHKTRKTGRKS
jgi:hypothetical protein